MKHFYPDLKLIRPIQFRSAICRQCRENIGKIIASKRDSDEPPEQSATPLAPQYPPSVVEPMMSQAESPLVIVILFCSSDIAPTFTRTVKPYTCFLVL